MNCELMMLVRLVYASRATEPVTEEMLGNILASSRENNKASGVTGLLCVCHDHVFLQVLEGGRKQVNQLYSDLLSDSRHSDVFILHYEEIRERQFANWRMGRVDVERLNPGTILKYSESAVIDPYNIPGAVALDLLNELMNTAAIVGRS